MENFTKSLNLSIHKKDLMAFIFIIEQMTIKEIIDYFNKNIDFIYESLMNKKIDLSNKYFLIILINQAFKNMSAKFNSGKELSEDIKKMLIMAKDLLNNMDLTK